MYGTRINRYVKRINHLLKAGVLTAGFCLFTAGHSSAQVNADYEEISIFLNVQRCGNAGTNQGRKSLVARD
jgi:hypothetical protein